VSQRDYLVSYGASGDFGRFRAAAPLACVRGDRVVVKSERGLELGAVLCPARERHESLPAGELLRLADAVDESLATEREATARELLERAATLAAELELPLEFLDAEVLLDGEHAVLQHVRWGDGDVRPLVRALAREHELSVTLTDLTRPQPEAEAHGCGNCGSEGGGCGNCGEGGGCKSGSCGSVTPAK
jgi:cell fate regulator YaaT (PSP1 superfamily)